MQYYSKCMSIVLAFRIVMHFSIVIVIVLHQMEILQGLHYQLPYHGFSCNAENNYTKNIYISWKQKLFLLDFFS